jgi:hypothetical protein
MIEDPAAMPIPVVVACRLVFGLSAEMTRLGVEPAAPSVKDFIEAPPVIVTV